MFAHTHARSARLTHSIHSFFPLDNSSLTMERSLLYIAIITVVTITVTITVVVTISIAISVVVVVVVVVRRQTLTVRALEPYGS